MQDAACVAMHEMPGCLDLHPFIFHIGQKVVVFGVLSPEPVPGMMHIHGCLCADHYHPQAQHLLPSIVDGSVEFCWVNDVDVFGLKQWFRVVQDITIDMPNA